MSPTVEARLPVGRWSQVALVYLVGVLISVLVGAVVIALLGHDPFTAFRALITSSFTTRFGIVQTLGKWSYILLEAMAFAIPMAANRWNIGGQGQFLAGAVSAVAAGIALGGLPAVVLIPAILVAGFLGGCLWAGIAAVLAIRFQVSEILSTVLLNFVGVAFADYVATSVWGAPGSGVPTTRPIAAAGLLPRFGSPPLSSAVAVGVVVVLVVTAWMRWSRAGYEIRAVGSNARAAAVHGIRSSLIGGLGLALGGALAGLAGALAVAGGNGSFIKGMDSNYMLLGIIVGLLARGVLVSIVPIAFGVAVLEVGGNSMQAVAQVPSEIVFIIEACILAVVVVIPVVRSYWAARRHA